MEKDFGIRFTDENYATRDDVKKALNISSIDSIWDKVTQFRAYYTRQTSLKNIERVPFSFVLPPKLTSKIVSLEKKLSKLLVKTSLANIQNSSNYNSFKNQCYFKILEEIAKGYGINYNQDTLNAIITNSIPTLPIEYLMLERYLNCLRHVETRYNGSFNEFVILSLYAKLRGLELDVNNLNQYYRTTDLLDRGDHVFVGQHYEAAPLEKIPDLINQLCDFLNDSTLFSVCKASICFFFINYIKPFEYYNEEMSVLLFKYVLSKEDFESLPSLVMFEDILSKSFESKLQVLSRESEMKLDLTYISNLLIDHLLEHVIDFENELASFDLNMVVQEQYASELPKTRHVVSETPIINHDSSNVEVEGVTFKQSVSLPTMPVGLDEKDADVVAKNLIEIYPSMKKGQAEFYSRHCTVGKYYTIAQYKKEQDVAYETARTSMDNLVALGFYKKEQIKNKFVYTPVIKK